MNKKSIWACLLGLSIPAFVVSCADLRDADVCYRAARLSCQKGDCTDPDQAHCIAQAKSACQNDSHFDEKFYTDCSDKVADLDDCAGQAAIDQACALSTSNPSGSQYGATCQDSSSCPLDSLCEVGVCVRFCSSDSQCSGVTLKGHASFCDDTGRCNPPCLSNQDCSNGLVCHDEGNGHKSCRTDTTTMPQPTTNAGLADSCSSSSDCDSTSGLSCQLGICTKTCKLNTDCSSVSSDGLCLKLSSLVVCSISCTSNANCDTGETCTTSTSTSGSSVRACTPSGTSMIVPKTLLGGSCKLSSDCQDTSLSCQQGICTKTCTGDMQCSGQTASGSTGRCVSLQPGSGLCLAGCSLANDNCDSTTTCSQAITSGGAAAYVCRPDQASTAAGGNVGDPCTIPGDCNQQLALVCSGGMCTKSCMGGSACPAASSPESSVCVLNSYCSATCDSNGCPAGWTCRLDPTVGADVCER